jgi:hypothetical protein
MELFTATGKLKKSFFLQLEMFEVCLEARIIAAVKIIDATMLTRV